MGKHKDLLYYYDYNRRDYVIEKERKRGQLPERKRELFNNHLKRSYGITFKEYSEMIINQAGCCAICNNKMMHRLEPHVDHCHKTGKVRSLLCFSCNLMIANAKENIQRLEQGIKYLKQHEIPWGVKI